MTEPWKQFADSPAAPTAPPGPAGNASAPWKQFGKQGTPAVPAQTVGGLVENEGFWTDVLARGTGQLAGLPMQTLQDAYNLAGPAVAGGLIGAGGELANQLTGRWKSLYNQLAPTLGLSPLSEQALRINYADLLPGLAQFPGNAQSSIEMMRRKFGVPEGGVEPSSGTQRFAGDFVANLIPNVALAGPAGLLRGAGAALTTPAPTLAKQVGQSVAAVAPPAAKVGLTTLGSTVGERVGEALVPDPAEHPMASSILQGLPTVGAAVGGSAVQAAPIKVAKQAWDTVQALRKAMPKATPGLDYQAQVAQMQKQIESDPRLQKILKDSVEDAVRTEAIRHPETLVQNIELAQRLSNELGVKFDVGQMTGSQQFINEVRRMATKNPAEIDAKIANDRKMLVQLREALAGKPGDADGIVRAVLDRAEAEAARVEGAAQSFEGVQQRAAEDVRARQGFDPERAARNIREGRAGVATELQTETRRVYGLVEDKAMQKGASYDLAPMLDTAQKVLASPRSPFGPENIPRIAGLIDRFVQARMADPAAPGITDFRTIRAMREALGQDIAEARGATDVAARSRLLGLRNLSSSLDDIVKRGDPDVAQLWDEAKRYYRTEVVPRTLTGINLKMNRKMLDNEFAIQNDKLVDTYLQPGRSVPLQRFMTMFKDRPERVAEIGDALVAKHANTVMKPDGSLNVAAHERFLSNNGYGRAIDALERAGVRVRERMQTPLDAYRNAGEMSARLHAQAKTMREQPILDRLRNDFGPVAPREAANTLLTERGAMDAFIGKLTAAEKPAWAEYLNDALADRLSEHIPATQTTGISPDKVKKFLNSPDQAVIRESYQKALEAAHGKTTAVKHMQTLGDVATAAEMLARTHLTQSEIGAIKGGKLWSSFKEKVGFTPTSLFAALRTMYRIQSPEYTAATFGSQAVFTAYNNLRDTVFKQAMNDANLANNLKIVLQAQKETPQAVSAAARIGQSMRSIFGDLARIVGQDMQKSVAIQAASLQDDEAERRQSGP